MMANRENFVPVSIDQELRDDWVKIPNRFSFKIGEVAELTGLRTSVLRYWETEFSQLKPKKSDFNQRIYSKKDIELVFCIKKLLYRDRFSIEGAQSVLRKFTKAVLSCKTEQETSENAVKHLGELCDFIVTAKQSL